MTKEKQEQGLQENSEIIEENEDLKDVDAAEDELSGKQTEDSQPEDELEKLRSELTSTREQMLRIAAESDNFKKRMARDKEALLKYAGENILREFLATLDNLDRALEQGQGKSEDPQKTLDALLEGVELTQKGLINSMEKFEVTPLGSVGEEFDPNQHEALTMEHSDEIPENHVLQEFAKGYQYKDRLLRAAKVIVSKGSAPE